MNLPLSLLRALGEKFFAPPDGKFASNISTKGKFDVDVCIVTNCAFPGGNASTTVTELETFTAAGLKTIIVHCPLRRSPWKQFWLAERYFPHERDIALARTIQRINCTYLIVRGPRMAMMEQFRKLARRIHTVNALFIVNNSAWDERGKINFDWVDLNRRVNEIGLSNSRIFPISPIIRAEAKRALSSETDSPMLAKLDWPPAFDVTEFKFAPRRHLFEPIVIGRHARDHEGKWLQDPDELRSAYPLDNRIAVRILGGADNALNLLGQLPSNWEVEPFGVAGVSDYLSSLDIFVNFPAITRDEAFGRTVVEAILSGLPVILPKRFEATFGELAIYCEPREVLFVIERMTHDDEARLHYINAARSVAISLFGAENLVKRLSQLNEERVITPTLDQKAKEFRRYVLDAVEA
ncbi:glycosyltransferase [Rhizobium sp. P32RR-XVIII]|uniref:glycosyltransferase n=1 Tax=Rhizobium sp. P32RR-XVIII TaxID=2726738 RepID=UPI0017ABFD17|nr:glycosyltransferase [Rhizobium sp. P32RR-XVIII]NLS07861.1 glycosyltransferase [Rhizobium sp. P32RR-XVIII]